MERLTEEELFAVCDGTASLNAEEIRACFAEIAKDDRLQRIYEALATQALLAGIEAKDLRTNSTAQVVPLRPKKRQTDGRK